jgi:hypothetical protein
MSDKRRLEHAGPARGPIEVHEEREQRVVIYLPDNGRGDGPPPCRLSGMGTDRLFAPRLWCREPSTRLARRTGSHIRSETLIHWEKARTATGDPVRLERYFFLVDDRVEGIQASPSGSKGLTICELKEK